MNSEIKNYIINNFKDDDIDVVKDAIISSILSSDEVALPGLGIFFVMLWESSNEQGRDLIVEKVFKQIKKG